MIRAGTRPYRVDTHGKELWATLKSKLCNTNTDNVLYNRETVKNKPADLGYYIGYKITKAYYDQAADKKQAIIDILEMNDPIHFLEASGYEQMVK